MERRIAPRGIVDPRVTPAGQPGPPTIPVRGPRRGNAGRKPDGAVFRIDLPRAIRREVGGAHHLSGDVRVLARLLVNAIAGRAPRIESVDAAAGPDIGLLVRNTGQGRGPPGQHLRRACRGCDLRLAFTHDHRRQGAVLRDVDSIEAGTRQLDLRGRRIDAHRVVRLEYAYPDDDTPGGDEERELPL